MKTERSTNKTPEKEPEYKRSFTHLFKIIAKELKAASKANPRSLIKRITHDKVDK